jgi:hypothetical protein
MDLADTIEQHGRNKEQKLKRKLARGVSRGIALKKTFDLNVTHLFRANALLHAHARRA